mgnify:CR=1 FL=1
MAAIHVTAQSFEEEVLKCSETVLVDFWAEWCGPCKMLLPIIEELAQEQTEVKVCKVNVSEHQELAEKYRVMTIPTLILFKNGEEIKRTIGAMPKPEVLEFIRN